MTISERDIGIVDLLIVAAQCQVEVTLRLYFDFRTTKKPVEYRAFHVYRWYQAFVLDQRYSIGAALKISVPILLFSICQILVIGHIDRLFDILPSYGFGQNVFARSRVIVYRFYDVRRVGEIEGVIGFISHKVPLTVLDRIFQVAAIWQQCSGLGGLLRWYRLLECIHKGTGIAHDYDCQCADSQYARVYPVLYLHPLQLLQ